MMVPASVEPMMTAVSSRQLASVRFRMRPMALRVTADRLRAARLHRAFGRYVCGSCLLGRPIPFHHPCALT